jgi:hypothetical protein
MATHSAAQERQTMTLRPRLTPIASALANALVLATPIALATQIVTTCADGGAGSLRSAIANAAPTGDTVTFNTVAMNCSAITLTTGALAVNATSLSIAGPTTGTLVIDANGAGRAFDHEGGGTLTISDLTITRGYIDSNTTSPTNGGCIYSKGSVVASNLTLDLCAARAEAYAFSYGGGIFAKGDLQLLHTSISRAYALFDPVAPAGTGGGFGGGAYTLGNLTVQSSTVTSSTARLGGALMTGGNATIVGMTLSGNAAYVAAGIEIYGQGQANITNSTITGNNAVACAGIVAFDPSAPSSVTVTLRNSTIAFNGTQYATFGGQSYAAGLCAAGTLNIQSTIVADNFTGLLSPTYTPSDFSAASGTSISGADNLIMATADGTTAPAGTLTADPLLGELADNGGPTMTHALQVGSPAIGKGNNLLRLASDQRGSGFARMTGRKTDIGAFQTGNGIFAAGFE